MNGFRYDPHTHTSETSKCGHLPAAEVVDRYVKNGFTGLVVTDHLHPEYLSRIDVDHNWDHVMDHYLSGYKASKKRGDELGFDVILGAEFRFPENDTFRNAMMITGAVGIFATFVIALTETISSFINKDASLYALASAFFLLGAFFYSSDSVDLLFSLYAHFQVM